MYPPNPPLAGPAGVHRKNKENLDYTWKGDALPLIRAAMSHDWFKMMLRFIRFDYKNTSAECAQADTKLIDTKHMNYVEQKFGKSLPA